jgi:hypothetical protein
MPIPEHWPPHVRERARRFLALWKYYRFSRTLSESAVPFVELLFEGAPQSRDDKFRGIALISYWIASLEVLCEGWKDLVLTDPTVDELMTDDHRDTLRRYRHTVFHFQPDLDERRIGALAGSPDAMAWVFALGEAFQGFFEHHSEEIDVEHLGFWLFAPTA